MDSIVKLLFRLLFIWFLMSIHLSGLLRLRIGPRSSSLSIMSSSVCSNSSSNCSSSSLSSTASFTSTPCISALFSSSSLPVTVTCSVCATSMPFTESHTTRTLNVSSPALLSVTLSFAVELRITDVRFHA